MAVVIGASVGGPGAAALAHRPWWILAAASGRPLDSVTADMPLGGALAGSTQREFERRARGARPMRASRLAEATSFGQPEAAKWRGNSGRGVAVKSRSAKQRIDGQRQHSGL